MKVPFRLVRRPADSPASALMLPGAGYGEALAVCARFELDPQGRVFAVDGGLLVRLESPSHDVLPGMYRLRSLAPNLWIPVDSDLVPALLDDEASALTKGRGLVFLPHGRPLAYDPGAAIDASVLLSARAVPRRDWTPPPEPPHLAARIEEFVVILAGEPLDGSTAENPSDVEDRTLGPGNEEIGSVPARPEGSGTAKDVTGRAAIGFGKALMGLGGALGLAGLAGLGARLIQGGMVLAPQLSEGILGEQEAALRELLKQFREGHTDEALRRALPMGDTVGPDRGAKVGAGRRLPSNDFRYRLSSLLGGDSNRGSVDVWMGDAEVLAALRREYQLAAERAIQNGDHRRAAFIYGKLLGDFRSAANTLMRGGLHRDAAALLLARLNDRRAAAMAYEAAGDFDRAIGLYRELYDHERAGDLLRRIGEEEAAVLDYIHAANRLVRENPRGGGRFAAGMLLRTKARRDDLAEGHFRIGWDRPNDDAALASCGLALLRLLADSGRGADLIALAEEAELRFAHVVEDRPAIDFYHEVVDVADIPSLASVRDELRDRARVGLADRLGRATRSGVRPSSALVSRILATGKSWTPSAVRDAEFAIASRLATPGPASRPRWPKLRFEGTGPITSACYAVDSEDIFLGFEGGEVIAFHPSTGTTTLASQDDLPVAGLATSSDGSALVVLRSLKGASRGTLSAHVRETFGGYNSTAEKTIDGLVDPWLTPIVRTGMGEILGMWDGASLGLLECGSLLGLPERFNVPDQPPSAAVLIARTGVPLPTILSLHDLAWWVTEPPIYTPEQIAIPHPTDYMDALPPMRHSLVSWSRPAVGMIEVVMLGRSGTLYWRLFRMSPPGLRQVGHGRSGTRGGYTAVAIVAPGLIAAAGENHVDWFAGTESSETFGLALRGSSPCDLARVAILFPSRSTGELIAIASDGSAVRMGDRPAAGAPAKR